MVFESPQVACLGKNNQGDNGSYAWDRAQVYKVLVVLEQFGRAAFKTGPAERSGARIR